MNQLNHKMMLNMIQFFKRDDDGFSIMLFPLGAINQEGKRSNIERFRERSYCAQENEE